MEIIRLRVYAHPSRIEDEDVISVIVSGVPYSSVLQQWTRHATMAFSVESSRASDLCLDYVPEWRIGQGKMFDQGKASPIQREIATAVWSAWKSGSRIAAWILRSIGIHRQHAQLAVKPTATVSMVVTAPRWSWEHFFSLRCDSTAQAEIGKIAAELRSRVNAEMPIPCTYGRLYGITSPSYGVAIDAAGKDLELRKDIASLTRVSTGKLLNSGSNPSWFVSRLLQNKHMSPFEHFFAFVPPRHQVGSCKLTGAVSLRWLLETRLIHFWSDADED